METPERRFRIVPHVIGPVGFVLAVLVMLFLFGFKDYLELGEVRRTAQYLQQAHNVWDVAQAESMQHLQWFAAQAAREKSYAAAMRRGDRDALLALAQPHYRELREQFGISHWYFISPDRKVFLRVHEPGLAGDAVGRKSLREAAMGLRPASGLELGMTATFTLRHVVPWQVGGELLGFIEMGMEVDWFAQRIQRVLGLEVIAAVHKVATTAEAFATGKHALGFSGNWADHPDFAILNQTLPHLPNGLEKRWSDFVRGVDPGVLMLRDGERVWAAGFLPLVDNEMRTVASIALLRDVGADVRARNRLLAMLGAGAALLVLLLIFPLYLRVRAIERGLNNG